MNMKTFDFDQNLGTIRKKFGASPTVITNKTQIPTVNILNEIKNNNNSDENDHSLIAPVDETSTGQNDHSPNAPVDETSTGQNDHSLNAPVDKTTTGKLTSARDSINKRLLDLKIKTSADCLRMYYLISELTDKLGDTWIEITRPEFEDYGVAEKRLVDARNEGLDRQLFEHRAIKALNKKTKKEYLKGYEYRLITK